MKILLKDYRSICKSKTYVSLIDSIFNRNNKKEEIGETQMLNSQILKSDNEISLFKNVLGKKPFVVDCWATWCNPCLKELPFYKKFKEEYKGVIDFFYLSLIEVRRIG